MERLVRRSLAVCLVAAVGSSGCFAGKADKSSPRTQPESLDPTVSQPDQRLGLTTAVPRRVVVDCRTLAARAHERGSSRPIYCLPLVPKAGWIRIEAAGGLNGYRNVAESIVIAVRSARKRPPVGRVVPTAHWTFAEGEPSAVIGNYLPADPGRRIRRTRLAGRPVTLYRMPSGGGLYSGHVVIEWRQRGIAFQVSMHGHRNLERTVLMARALMRQVARCPRMRADSKSCELVF